MVSAPGRRRCARREQQRGQKKQHHQQGDRDPPYFFPRGPAAQSRLVRQAAQTAAIMLALHLRLCAAFMSTPATAARLQQARSAAAAVQSCGWGKGEYGSVLVPRKPFPPLVFAMRAATAGAASPESAVGTEARQSGR